MQTSPKPFCFVLMPFEQKFNDVYQLGIKAACLDAGAYCERVDEQIFHERILDRIYNQIAKADFIVADMTDRNPNVFYEVGYAHALSKRAVLLTRHAEDIPFDLKHFPHIVYGESIATLKDQLTDRLKYFLENKATPPTMDQLPVELFLGDDSLSSGNVHYTTPPREVPNPVIVVKNCSRQVLYSGQLKLGVITPSPLPYLRNEGARTTLLPGGKILHVLPPLEDLFPEEFSAQKILFETLNTEGPPLVVKFRVFTDIGTFDFPLTIHLEAPRFKTQGL